MTESTPPPRTWTLEEANEALGRVSEQVGAAMAAARDGDRAGVVAAAEHLAVEGVVLRDVGSGLIDFVAVSPTGRQYLLCWMWGEPEIDTWHWPEDGFAGRTPCTELPA